MSKYIDAEKLKKFKETLADIIVSSQGICTYRDCKEIAEREALLLIATLQQEQPKKRLIQVKCLYPYDESWQKNKVYTCEVWHHGDLNRDFWDVYYDYGKDPKYVQFPTIELLNEEFVIIQEEPQVIPEQPEGNLEYWLEHFGMPKENIDNCITQIAQGYGACRYLEGIQHGAEAVNELAKQEQPEVDLEKELKIKKATLLDDAFGLMNGEQSLAIRNFARHFAEWGAIHLNARREE